VLFDLYGFMQQVDRDFLDKHRYDAPRLPMSGLENLLRIVQENFNNGYKPDLYCDVCVVGLIKLAYECYDKFLKNEAGNQAVL
jgi:hypothetical protein